jgi:hypothetical protein
MNDMTQNDLFGHKPAQGSFFDEGENRMVSPKQSDEPDPVVIRKRMQAVIAKAKSAKSMPWNQNDAEVWQIIFPNLASWLPEEEGKQLVLEFEQEMQRLAAA